MPSYRRPFAILLLMWAAASAGCLGNDDSDSSDAETAAAVHRSDCTPDTLKTVQKGKLTVATDSPAAEPYFVDDDPTNGQGFESAMAYAVADRLGFEEADVTWTVVPLEASYSPGEKDFDFALNQVSITAERARLVDFSSPYYEAKQGIVVLKDLGAAFESLDDLKGLNIGVQSGTTSVHAVEHEIDPDNAPQVFDLATDVLTALKQGQVDAVVVDLPMGFYLTAFEIPEATLAGQFDAHSDEPAATVQWGAVLERDSPLTECVSAAILDLRDSGELAKIEHEWMSDEVNVPVLEE